MNYEQALDKLTKYGQQHLLRFYGELNEAQKKRLLSQIEATDFEVLSSMDDMHKAERGRIAPLEAMQLPEIEKKKEQFRKTGLDAIRGDKVGAVLLAGGMGTRLGSDAPKGVYNIGVTKDLYIFECLIHNLMQVTAQAGHMIYLYIMTSDKNHDQTVAFFKEHQCFGYPQDHIFFFMQEMAPAVDHDGKVYLEEKDKIATSPNGNGGWFVSMAKSGILDQVRKTGIEWLNVFAVDNVLQKIADPVFVGACIEEQCNVGAKVVAKANPDEKVGVMCLEDGKPSIIEYYELTEEMRQEKNDRGEYAYNYGVILNYLFRVSELERTMSHKLPHHKVEKKIAHIDETGTKVNPQEPNGYKFEQLVLDMIHDMDKCLPFEVVREHEFAPIKNKEGVDSVDTARALLVQNGIQI